MRKLPRPLEGIRFDVLEATLEVGRKIGLNVLRGRRLGALFVLGDCRQVLQGSRQLVPNPFLGHPEEVRFLTDPTLHDMLVELSKLDGAFVVRGDGFIETAATFLSPGPTDVSLPAGLGARHVIAASVTARTKAVAVAISASDGDVRLFMNGELAPQTDLIALALPLDIEQRWRQGPPHRCDDLHRRPSGVGAW